MLMKLAWDDVEAGEANFAANLVSSEGPLTGAAKRSEVLVAEGGPVGK